MRALGEIFALCWAGVAIQGGLLAAYAAGMPVVLLADGDGETCVLGESHQEAVREKRRAEL